MSGGLCMKSCLGCGYEGGGIPDKGSWSVGRAGSCFPILAILEEELGLSRVSTNLEWPAYESVYSL